MERTRSAASVATPVGLADDLVDAALFGPACGDALDARAAAVHEHHIVVLGADLVEPVEDRSGVAYLPEAPFVILLDENIIHQISGRILLRPHAGVALTGESSRKRSLRSPVRRP